MGAQIPHLGEFLTGEVLDRRLAAEQSGAKYNYQERISSRYNDQDALPGACVSTMK